MKKFLFITLPVILIAFISAYTFKQLSYDKSVKAINLTPVKGKAIAAFAEGCFWHTELVFESLLGVDSVISGYAGGHTENPSYSQVGTESTGHAEAVLIYYNPEIISYEELVKVYYLSHNPLQVNGQGNDIGSQYRSVAFGNYDISAVTRPFYARYFVTNISGVSTVVTYNLFELDKNATSWNQAFKSLYVGVGIGVEKVNVLSIRTDATLANGEKYLFAIRESPYVQVAIPVVAGFNYYIPQSPLAVGIKGQLGIIPQDELEGYATNINGKPDFYALGSISLKYYFKKANRHNSNKGF